MKENIYLKKKLNCSNNEEVFSFLVNNFKETINGFDFFVDWDKVLKKYSNVEIFLNILNVLIGKENIEEELRSILKEYPKLIQILPCLIALRDKKIKLLSNSRSFEFSEYDFSKNGNIDKAVNFMKEVGFLERLSKKQIKSIPDYFLGVEVGLDTNGRKNRTGSLMEDIVEEFLKEICLKCKFSYIRQATAKDIKEKWNKNITVKESSKRIDFAVNTSKQLFLIETNYYKTGGSKLKSTAGEYTEIFSQWKKDGHQFIWITDGIGWYSSKKPLKDAFDSIDFILNLEMIQRGVLKDLLSGK
ncbi:MAG: restriction endonuclease [Alphaproteobacteria bacterium]|nr:restriction endonuclease [Alphaproteobacteria bacterium]